MYKIIDYHNLCAPFLKEWFNGKPFVGAHTSGSTGTPKDIMLLKEDMLRSASATNRFFGINPNSTLLCPLSLDYIAGKMMVVRAIASGATLIVEPPSNEPMLSDFETVDLLPIVPSQIESVCNSPNCGKVRNLIVGGAPVSATQKKLLLDSGIKSYQTYGMTETCSHVALAGISEDDMIYEGLPGITFATVENDCLKIIAPDFSFSPLVTRDIVSLVDETHFRWKGRLDNVVNSGGLKFFPEEIENLLTPLMAKHSGITGFYVRGIKSEKWGEELQLVVESEADINADRLLSEIKEFLTDKRMTPKSVKIKPSLLRTGSGKIRRS